jgi:peptidoglycan/xylan/chitin deacetylase (PgdA/CDA1 family)
MDGPTETTASPVRQMVKRALVRTLPGALLRVRQAPESRGVFLTFDDGPHPEHTPRLLDVLREQGVQATFFVVGQRAEERPDLVRRIANEGHALGHHSFSHGDPERTSAGRLAAEANKTSALLERLVGRAPRLFRPPHGKVTAGKLLLLWHARQAVILWNVDPKDFALASPEELRVFFERHTLDAGDIVLLHDTCPHAAEVIPFLTAEAQRRGLKLMAMDG